MDAARRMRARQADVAPDAAQDPGAAERARGLLDRMGRGISAGVGARDRWTARALAAARSGVLVTGIAAGMGAVAGAGGPALHQSPGDIQLRGDTPWSHAVAGLERGYAERLDHVTPIVVDVDALDAMVAEQTAVDRRAALDDWVTARLQAEGNFALNELVHRQIVRQTHDMLRHPVNATRVYVGYAHADGPADLGFQAINLITTAHPFQHPDRSEESDATRGLPFSNIQDPAVWQRYVTIHELEHAVDNDRTAPIAKMAQRLLGAETRFDARDVETRERLRVTDDAYRDEAYADVKAAISAVIDTGGTGIAQLISDQRALLIAHAVSTGDGPIGFSHFASPAIDRMIADVDSGKVAFDGYAPTERRTRAEDDALHAVAERYVAQAYADYQQVDLGRTMEVVKNRGAHPLAQTPETLERAGWPPAMTGAVRRAVEHYQNHLDCAPSRPGASFVRCTVVDADGTPSTRKVATAIAGTGHPRSAKDSNYAREHSWPAARVHDPALPAAGSTASLLGAAAGVAAAGIEATHPRGRARQALRGLQLAGQPAALDALGAGPAQVQASALAQAGRTLRGLSDSLQPGSPLAQAARTIEARTQGRAQQLAAGAHRTVPDRDGVAR